MISFFFKFTTFSKLVLYFAEYSVFEALVSIIKKIVEVIQI